MKTKFTTLINLLIICVFSISVTYNSVYAQGPVFLNQLEIKSLPSASGFTDCSTAPIITCPSTYTGCAGEEIAPDNTGFASAVAGDAFCEAPVVTYTDEIISQGPCTGELEIHRMWTATYPDETYNYLFADCTQLIFLKDEDGPSISGCPDNILTSPGENCEAIVNWTAPTATDVCGLDNLVSSHNSGDSFAQGETIVTYTATDLCGNSTVCTFTVTVEGSCCTAPPTISCPEDFNGCPETEVDVALGSYCDAEPTTYTGWAVATCNAEANTDDPVGVIYDIRNTGSAPQSSDWAPSITDLHPANWTLGQIGQIFGIAIGSNDVVYLAASDIYDTGYNTDPFGPGQIFVAHPDNDFLAEPFVALPNTGGALNGIGNIVYDRLNHQLFASNLEDGKIYRIGADGSILDTYDPWDADNGSDGIVAPSEQVWGIGLNSEDGVQKIYFARLDGSIRDMYSITLTNGNFPAAGSETVEISNVPGVGERISDIAFSADNSQMIFSERGTKFTTGAHDVKTLKYNLNNGTWTYDIQYFVGSWVTEQYPGIVVDPGENTAGGVSFGPIDVNDDIEGCDQLVWTTMNYFRTEDGNLYYGIQGMNVDGNNPNTADIDPNIETDIIVDFDGVYDNFVQKGDLGDVEVFQADVTITAPETGVATAETAADGCGEALITFEDDIISEGTCGAITINRIWTATDSNNSTLSSSCTQVITLEDTEAPAITNLPDDITIAPNNDCTAIVTWTEPTFDDNCGLASSSSNITSGSTFDEGTTAVTYTAIDNCGLSTTASFTVTVSACCVAPPTITCPADYQECIGASIGTNFTGNATASPGSSTCQSPIISYDDEIISAGPCDGAISIIRTWTATDPDNGLTASCEQSVIITDENAPVISNCPSDITIETSTGGAQVTWNEPTAQDGCGLEWLMGDFTSGDTFEIGVTEVTYTAQDFCGNTTLCSFTVTVESAGTITCNDDIVVECGDAAGTPISWDLPEIVTGCSNCNVGDSIPGFIYMGSLDGSLYYCSTAPAASSSASAIASSNGGYLATINSQEENDLLSGFLNSQCALIGLSDSAHEGTFVWSNGEPLEYTNWANYQPNNEGGNQDCTVLCADGWNDTQCEVAYEFIMEIPCTTYEQTSGLPNGSIFPVGTDTISYLVTDACGTELSCSFTVTVDESVHLVCPGDYTFTCPAGATNVTAYWDTPELETCCTGCDSGNDEIAGYMYMGSYGGSKYYCSLANATWPAANSISKSHGGYLAEINDAYENAFLANILTLQRAWIGLNDAGSEGSFKWSTGSAPTYTNWYANQPNNTNNYQDYVAMLNDGQWNDEYNNIAMEYIMEIPCSSVVQIGGPSSGSSLPIGVTTITYAGIDACGNTDTCSFDITINGTVGCQSYGQESWYTWIENFGLGSYANPSGNNGGYGDFTDGQCVDIVSGHPFPITLTPGFASNIYTMYWKVWIDYNHDGDYLDAGEYIAYGAGHQELNGVVTIPTSCILGETTMRVSMKYGAYPSGPCAIFSHGEVEDYCVNISGGSSSFNGLQLTTDADAPVLLGSNEVSKRSVSTDLEADILARQSPDAFNTNSKSEIQVYPNPTTHILNVELKDNKEVEFILLNSEGKKAMNSTLDFSNGSQSIDLSGLPNGVYLLRSMDGKYSKKVLVQK
jgi:hypothetical protein